MGCFPCCSPHHPPGSYGGNSGKTGYYNQPGMTPGYDRAIGPGMGPEMAIPGQMPPRKGIGRFGPY